jgi:hypothetical protein
MFGYVASSGRISLVNGHMTIASIHIAPDLNIRSRAWQDTVHWSRPACRSQSARNARTEPRQPLRGNRLCRASPARRGSVGCSDHPVGHRWRVRRERDSQLTGRTAIRDDRSCRRVARLFSGLNGVRPDDQRVTRRPHRRTAAAMMPGPPGRLDLGDQAAEVPPRPPVPGGASGLHPRQRDVAAIVGAEDLARLREGAAFGQYTCWKCGRPGSVELQTRLREQRRARRARQVHYDPDWPPEASGERNRLEPGPDPRAMVIRGWHGDVDTAGGYRGIAALACGRHSS